MSADSPVVILYDSAGDPIHSYDFGGSKHLATAILQDAHGLPGNSSTDNLLAQGTFTGTAEDVSGVASIRVLTYSDQIVRMSVQQSSDGTNWDVDDAWLVYPDAGSGRMIQVISLYVRVIAQNLSPNATTEFRLNTVLCPVANPLPRALTNEGTLRMSSQTTSTVPDKLNFTRVGQKPSLRVDNRGGLNIRGQILTDERSFRDDFTDSDVAVALSGVLTFQDDVYVSGNSTSFLTEITIGDYVKLDSDGIAALTIVADVLSDTLMVLEEAYKGTPGTGTSTRANWYLQSGGTGTVSHSTSTLELNSGTTPGCHATVLRTADYPPFSMQVVAKIDHRYANQDSYLGVMETAAHLSDKMAAVKFDGTDNTIVKLVTSFNADDKEETSIVLADGATTDDYHDYRLSVTASSVQLWIDQVKVAEHFTHLIGPYDTVQLVCGIANMDAVTGESTLSVDVVYFSNFNQLDTVLTPRGDGMPIIPYKAPLSAITSIAAAVADTELLETNLMRVGASIYNDSTSVCYLKLGTGASDTSFTVRMVARSYYELPFGYIGPVHGYWASANGYARLTEVR
jgi:hypothetical protein